MTVYDGNDWKHAADSPDPERPLTRAQAQRIADLDYAAGRLSRAAWNRRTDALSYARGDDATRVLDIPR